MTDSELTPAAPNDLTDMVGMGSQADKERQLAQHRALLAGRHRGSEDPCAETALARAALTSPRKADQDALVAGARSDLAREAQRLAANAPFVEAQIDAMKERDRRREARHRRLASQMPPDRMSGEMRVVGDPSRQWERLAARGFAEAASTSHAPHLLPGAELDPDYRDNPGLLGLKGD